MNKPNGILNTSLVKAGNKYITNRKKATVGDLFIESTVMRNAYAELFEQLVLFDRVSIVLGPLDYNGVAVLARGFGSLSELERAIKLETVEIVLPRTMLMVGLGSEGKGEHDPSLLWGTPALIAGRMEIKDLGDPEIALLDGLRFLPNVDEGRKRGFAKRMAKYVKPGSLNSDDEAIKVVINAYNSDSLRSVGMPFIGNESGLNAQGRIKLQTLASEVDDLLFVAENNYGVYGRSPIYDLAKSTIGKIEDLLEVQKSTDHILETMTYPNLRLLFLDQKAMIRHAITIRESNDGIYFRDWIHENSDPAERKYLIKKFIEATPIHVPGGKMGEILKGVTMNAFGKISGAGATIVGASAGGILGGPPGAGIGAVAGFATDVLLGLLGDKLLGPFFKGFVPKQFTDRIKNLAEKEDRVFSE